MDQMKTKFCLSRRIEEYYFEEESLDDNFSDNEYSVICNLIHQGALNRAKKLDIKNRVDGYLNQRPTYLNYTSDGDSLYSSPQLSNPRSISFNRKKFDLLENRVNYFRPTEAHKQRQSDILPLDRYEQIIKDSPFDSPISFENRRATVLPNFKTRAFEQSTQTSFNYENNYDDEDFKNEIHKSINKLSINNLIDKSNKSTNKSTNKSINLSKSIKNKSSSKINETNLNKEFSNYKIDSRSQKISNSKINSTKNKSKLNYDKSHYITNGLIEEPDDFENSQIKKRLAQTELIESLADDETLKSLRLNSLSNRKSNEYSSKLNTKLTSTVDKTKNFVGLNDPTTDLISKSTNVTKSINSRISFPLDTPIFDSEINEKSTPKSVKKTSLSKDQSKLISTANSSKSIAKSLSTDNASKPKNQSKRKSRSLKVLRNSTNLNRKSSIGKQNSNKAEDENQLRKSILKKSVSKLIEENKQNDSENISLIFNSTKDPNNEDENLNLEDISVIGFENESQNESCDLEIVFDDDDDDDEIKDQQVSLIKSNKEINQQKLPELFNFNDEIEMIRKSFDSHSVPEASIVQTSISESLSQQESMKKSLENEKIKNNELTESKKQMTTNLDLSIEFGESADEDDTKNKSIERNSTNKKLQILKSTPKSILKTSSKSKRNWEASGFSLVNLTINSASKSISNNSSGQKINSVRFSDKVLEKFTNEILNSQKTNDDDEMPLIGSKNEEEQIIVNEKHSKDNAKSSDNLPDLNESYDNLNLNKESLSKNSNDEENKLKEISIDESEESLNVTIDDLSLSLIEDENEEKIETQTKSLNKSLSNKSTTNKTLNESFNSNDKTPINQITNHQSTFIVKSLKKPARPIKKQSTKNMNIKNLLPKYYETFVDKTPTIIYPANENDDELQEDNCLVRRSNRIRVRPLDYWRNQKPKYKKDAETKCLTIAGVDKGFVFDNPFKKKITKSNPERKDQVKRKRSGKLKVLTKRRKTSETLSIKEKVEEQKEKKIVKIIKKIRYEPNEVSIHQELNKTAIELSDQIKKEASEFCSQNELKWVESKQSAGVFMSFMSRKKDKSGNTSATGFMKLASLLKKPQQKSANYVTRYVVMFGCCSVIINDKPPVILKSMDSFIINKDTYFSIENLRKDELLLYFDVSSS